MFLSKKKHKFQVCLNSYTLYNDTYKDEASFGIILLSFVYFYDDVPDDGHAAET